MKDVHDFHNIFRGKTRLKRGYNIFRFYKNAHITKKSTETRFTKLKSFSQLNNSQI